MADKIIMPLGELAGHELDLPHVLLNLATDLLGQRDKLQAKAYQKPREAAALKAHAADAERYALALFITWWQVEDPETREMHLSNGLLGWLDMARRHNLALPPDMAEKARKDTPKR